MPYDNTCKFIAENFPSDIASWLLGQPLALSKLEPSELSLEPIRVDSLILLQSEELVLHCEFQTDPDLEMAFRMADYRLRIYRRFPHKQMRQVVVYLRKTQSSLVYQTTFELATTRHTFEVIRLWEQPTETFLNLPGLLPFAVLTQTNNRARVLQEVATRSEDIPDLRQRRNIVAASGLLAGLVLKGDVIRQLLRQDIMRESVIYQEIEAEGVQKGLQQGLQQEAKSLVLRQLARRIGTMPPELLLQIEALPLTQLEDLGEALLDFASPADLESWLQTN
jgi:predicted transposase/invertase (TIGR01784 family)